MPGRGGEERRDGAEVSSGLPEGEHHFSPRVIKGWGQEDPRSLQKEGFPLRMTTKEDLKQHVEPPAEGRWHPMAHSGVRLVAFITPGSRRKVCPVLAPTPLPLSCASPKPNLHLPDRRTPAAGKLI